MAAICFGCGICSPPATPSWLQDHHIPLLAALIPQSIREHLSLPCTEASRFLNRLHISLATLAAERYRRREALINLPSDAPLGTLHPNHGQFHRPLAPLPFAA